MIVTIPTNHTGLRYFYSNKILFKNIKILTVFRKIMIIKWEKHLIDRFHLKKQHSFETSNMDVHVY